MKLLISLLCLAVLALGVVGCVPGDDGPSGADQDVRLVPAPIDELDILVRESSPPGYTLHIVSGLPSGCAKFVSAKVTDRSGDTITVEVTNSLPADDDVACTAIYGMYESNLDLGTDFEANRTYTVKVNDAEKTFVAQ